MVTKYKGFWEKGIFLKILFSMITFAIIRIVEKEEQL